METLAITPVADIRTGYGEKFGVPRQPGLSPSAKGRVVLRKPFRNADTLREIETFSHLWLIFGFHLSQGWTPTVRPPRLGGNERVGVFASRSPFRPNPLGLSVVALDGVDTESPDGPALLVSGADLVDGTPVYDIKPYLAYADVIAEARSGFATTAPVAKLNVAFSPEAEAAVAGDPALRAFVGETLALDPRPAFHDEPERVYGVSLAGRNVRFRVAEGVCTVVSL